MNETIRRAKPREAERLSAIALAARQHWGYPSEWMNLWEDESALTPEYVSQEHVYCADSGADVLGFYSVESRTEFWEFEHFWVLPCAMGEGIGRRLFNHAVDLVHDCQGKHLRIVSDPHAEGFYLKLGAYNVGSVPSAVEGRDLPVLVT